MDDDISKLIAVLKTAIAIIEPQIRGLSDLMSNPNPVPADVMLLFQAQMAARTQRLLLIRAAIDALEKLAADGYPVLGTQAIPRETFNVLQALLADVEKATHIFEEDGGAATALELDKANAVSTPQPMPTT
jgi:hypothetical protein